MTELSDLERQVMESVLRGDHPVLVALRLQFTMCQVAKRDFSGAGFFVHFESVAIPSLLDGFARIGGVFADVEGLTNGAGFVVMIEEGRLSLLEGFSYGEVWPSVVRSFRIYDRDGEPDLSTLNLRQ